MAVTDPKPMSRAAAIAYAICSPLSLIALVFLPVGRLEWKPEWIFVAFLVAAFGASALILARVNPSIYRARSRIALSTLAQAVNPFFEPGVRIQRERGQQVISKAPYAAVRHPGYAGALMIFAGLAPPLASWWALIPAASASLILIVR